jgi:hypothetical protein
VSSSDRAPALQERSPRDTEKKYPKTIIVSLECKRDSVGSSMERKGNEEGIG